MEISARELAMELALKDALAMLRWQCHHPLKSDSWSTWALSVVTILNGENNDFYAARQQIRTDHPDQQDLQRA
jgi:hypothetical protein